MKIGILGPLNFRKYKIGPLVYIATTTGSLIQELNKHNPTQAQIPNTKPTTTSYTKPGPIQSPNPTQPLLIPGSQTPKTPQSNIQLKPNARVTVHPSHHFTLHLTKFTSYLS